MQTSFCSTSEIGISVLDDNYYKVPTEDFRILYSMAEKYDILYPEWEKDQQTKEDLKRSNNLWFISGIAVSIICYSLVK